MKRKIFSVLMISSTSLLVFLGPSFGGEPNASPAPDPGPASASGTLVPPPDGAPNEAIDISDTEEKQLTTDIDVSKQAAPEIHDTGIYWKAPDYSNQTKALGWTPDTFKVPAGFQRRVNFWIDIYTKYKSSDVLIHDAHYLDIVYKTLDLSAIDKDATLDPYQREKAKRKIVKEEKKKVREQLLRIQAMENTPDKLSPEDYEIYKKFRFVVEKNKFRAAAERHRLRMQLGQKDHFLMGLYFSGRYIRKMEEIFREENVPIELTRLPFVESSFNPYAYSKVGASGIWQFMRSTGRLFLKINSMMDFRNDPLTATRAAAKLLRYNYTLLGSWPLALTAYNHGPEGVARIVKKLKTDDINEIVWNTNRHKFGFASENFYAEFLAALEVESHADKYFGKVQVSPPMDYEEMALPRQLTFGEFAYAMRTNDKDDGMEMARLYNPFFTRGIITSRRPIPEGTIVRVPRFLKDKFLGQLKTLDPSKIKVVAKSGLYKILRGDTLTSISRDFGVSVRELLQANNLTPHAILRPGRTLVVPTVESH